MQSDSEDADAPGGVLYHGQDIGLGAVEQVGGEEVARQDRLGLGAQELRPGRTRSAAARDRSRHSSGFSMPSTPLPSLPGRPARRGSAVSPPGVFAGQPEDQGPDVPAGGWPPILPRIDLAAQRRRMMSRCQRRIVSGVTSSRSPCRRAFGITASRVASRARSAQSRFGRRGCRRCSTASWWRRSRISAVCHASSRRDSRSHEVIRVIRRKTNRRHMTGDHHGRTAGRATLLVTAVDGILGTHSICHRPRRDVTRPGHQHRRAETVFGVMGQRAVPELVQCRGA